MRAHIEPVRAKRKSYLFHVGLEACLIKGLGHVVPREEGNPLVQDLVHHFDG